MAIVRKNRSSSGKLFVKPQGHKYGDGGGEYIRDRLGTDNTGYSAEERKNQYDGNKADPLSAGAEEAAFLCLAHCQEKRGINGIETERQEGKAVYP